MYYKSVLQKFRAKLDNIFRETKAILSSAVQLIKHPY